MRPSVYTVSNVFSRSRNTMTVCWLFCLLEETVFVILNSCRVVEWFSLNPNCSRFSSSFCSMCSSSLSRISFSTILFRVFRRDIGRYVYLRLLCANHTLHTLSSTLSRSQSFAPSQKHWLREEWPLLFFHRILKRRCHYLCVTLITAQENVIHEGSMATARRYEMLVIDGRVIPIPRSTYHILRRV